MKQLNHDYKWLQFKVGSNEFNATAVKSQKCNFKIIQCRCLIRGHINILSYLPDFCIHVGKRQAALSHSISGNEIHRHSSSTSQTWAHNLLRSDCWAQLAGGSGVHSAQLHLTPENGCQYYDFSSISVYYCVIVYSCPTQGRVEGCRPYIEGLKITRLSADHARHTITEAINWNSWDECGEMVKCNLWQGKNGRNFEKTYPGTVSSISKRVWSVWDSNSRPQDELWATDRLRHGVSLFVVFILIELKLRFRIICNFFK